MSKHLEHDYNLRQRRGDGKVCPKTSFDRFGDDLSELILNFLPLEDKFRFECLNRRIQSFIYNKENRLKLDSGDISKHIIKKNIDHGLDFREANEYDRNIRAEECDFNPLIIVLKKLNAINSIQIESYSSTINGQLLITIADHCKHLTSIELSDSEFISEEEIDYFGQKVGQKLKHLDVTEFEPKAAIRLLKLTPNLESIRIKDFSDILCSEEEILVPKLRDIRLVGYKAEELDRFHQQYGDSIKKLRITLVTRHGIKIIAARRSLEVMKQLSMFNRLTYLHLDIINYSPLWIIEDYRNLNRNCIALRDMFEGMTKLKKLVITYARYHTSWGSVEDLHRLIKLLSESKQLKATDVWIHMTVNTPKLWVNRNRDLNEDYINEELVEEMSDHKLDKYFAAIKVRASHSSGFDVDIRIQKNSN